MQYRRVACADIIKDGPTHYLRSGTTFRLLVIVMAEDPAHVCYRKGTDVTNGYLQRRVSPRLAIKAPDIQSHWTCSTLECHRKEESSLVNTQSRMLYPRSPTPSNYTQAFLILAMRIVNQALPSSTAALIEAKNFAGQVDNSASLGMPFSRTCLMILCCSLAINS